jgi:phospholipase C
MNFRQVLNAVNQVAPGTSVSSARDLVQRIQQDGALAWLPAVPREPLSLYRLMRRALAWRMKFVIRHVFVLMMENRSFDHIFGFSGITGRSSLDEQMTELDGLLQNGFGTTRGAPFSLVGTAGDVGHEFLDVLEQLCGSAAIPQNGVLSGGVYPPVNNSGFVANFVRNQPHSPPETPMQCFDPAQLPALNTLATEFAVCDKWFASLPGPTWPNRFFVHAASATGQVDSPSGPRIVEAVQGPDPFTFHNGTIYDRIDQGGLQHRIYSATDCAQVSGIQGNRVEHVERAPLGRLQQDLQAADFNVSYIFIEPDYGPQGFAGIDACHSVAQNDMHPPSDIRAGEGLIRQVYQTIRNSPVWNQSVLVIIFDEHGGFFDHVPPPRGDQFRLQDGSVDNTHHFQFDQLGVRIPAVIASPWIPRNVIDSNQYDHTSLLATVERLFGLGALTQRDANANQFLELFFQIEPRADTPQALP